MSVVFLTSLMRVAAAQDLSADTSLALPSLTVEGTAYHDVPVINLSAAIPELAEEVGRDDVVRAQDCVVADGEGLIAVLVTGGEPPVRRHRSQRQRWQAAWGPGRVPMVLIGGEAEGTYTGRCTVKAEGEIEERIFDWSVVISGAEFPQRTLADPGGLRQFDLDSVSMFLKKTVGWRERGVHEGEVGALDYVVSSAWMAWEYVGISPRATAIPAS